MGSICKAHCSCGLVDVNFRRKPIACPTWFSRDLIKYGDPSISIPTKYNTVIQAWDFNCGQDGHLCPSCKIQPLSFYQSFLTD